MSKSKSIKERLYKRHEHLAEYYASKIFNESNISLEREDLVQDLKMKMWLSIKAYVKKWRGWRQKGIVKPIPLEFYLKATMVNMKNDYIKVINRSINIPMSAIEFDYGRDDFQVEVDFENKRLMVDHVDLLDGLRIEEKKFFMLYLKGLPISKINRIYKGNLDPRACMRINIENMRQRIPDMISEVREFKVMSFDEE